MKALPFILYLKALPSLVFQVVGSPCANTRDLNLCIALVQLFLAERLSEVYSGEEIEGKEGKEGKACGVTGAGGNVADNAPRMQVAATTAATATVGAGVR